MKKMFIAVSAILVGLLTQATSCERNQKTTPDECGDVACTMMFAMITVEIKDGQNNKVLLDEYYTIREKTSEKLTHEPQMTDSGTYTILDDNYVATLKNTSEKFRFIGKKNGTQIVNEEYTISADCCHVNRVSGKDVITIP